MIRVAPALAFLALALLPFVLPDPFLLHLMTSVAIAAILALGLQFLLGISGQLSLGQAAFYGVGAYGSALMTGAGVPFLVAVPLAAMAAGASSLILIPVTRLRGPYLAVATLGFSIAAYLVIKNEEWLTGGSLGLMGISRPTLFGLRLRDPAHVYWLCAGLAALVWLGLCRLADSRFGRAAHAIRQDEDAARASGLRVTLIKTQCFVVSAVISGLAGALFAHHIRYLGPADFSFWKSVEVLIMVVIGGVGSAAGAVLGAAVVVLLPEWLRLIGDYRLLVFGATVVVLMLFGSGGLAGLWGAIRRPRGAAP
ncbi:branched-chain amino acid ABC transporter permease [Sabulicella rubraurantiaca]|uniref:branched-chain amino acid ABC transporter permease n=1 Tax=Sabulicella rubraurantiaca TaxID=2811429 RepID=UPI001F29080E|nr:branched-chain amino acid ABC transporter permease [Sabulicella rubraurantiaca]